ncbi:MAG: septum formation initiator family protein [Bacteriovorax sp.]
MEFSFDRSNESAHLRNTTQPTVPAGTVPIRQQLVEPQTPSPVEQQAAPYDDGIDTATIANERLRKAIERNRARQAERMRSQPQVQAQTFAEPQSRPQEQASLFDRPQEKMQEEPARVAPPQRPRAQERAQATAAPKSSAVATRRSVARPDETDFTPTKRAPRKMASQISYTTSSSSSRKKSKPIDPTLVGYLVKGCWIFCGIMVLRLIFANGGVTDYYSHRSVFNDRLLELDRIKKENMQLVQEIERMQSDTAFQKKLVRDNLGFIASDEFLVLFPKEKSAQ